MGHVIVILGIWVDGIFICQTDDEDEVEDICIDTVNTNNVYKDGNNVHTEENITHGLGWCSTAGDTKLEKENYCNYNKINNNRIRCNNNGTWTPSENTVFVIGAIE